MSKKGYKSEGEDLFIEYLPPEIYKGLTKKEYIHYREYRRYHRFLKESKDREESYRKKIDKLKSKIEDEKLKRKDEKYEEGWQYKMKYHYEQISHLHKDLDLKVHIEERDRSSKSYKYKQGEYQKKDATEVIKNEYGGEEIERLVYWYGRIFSVMREYRISVYLGKESKVKKNFEGIFDEKTLKYSQSLRRKLRKLIIQYTRYHVYHSDWETFNNKTHNLTSLIDWVNYCKENKIDRNKWGTWIDLK